MNVNISPAPSYADIASVFHLLSQPVRIQILLVIGRGEACVCHLEAYLGLRQAVISQHLMILRKARFVEKHRNGRNIYYHLARPELIDVISQIAGTIGLSPKRIADLVSVPVQPCPCPHCNPRPAAGLECSHTHITRPQPG